MHTSCTIYINGGRFLTRIKCVCDLDLLTLFGVFTDILVAVFCRCRLTLLALRGVRGVAKPSLFNFKADRVSLVGVHRRLLLGVIIFKCWMFSFPIFGVSGVGFDFKFFFGVSCLSSNV